MSGTSYRVSARLQIDGDAARTLTQVSRALTALDTGIQRTERSLRALMRALNGVGGAAADIRRASAAMSQLQSGAQTAGQSVRGTTQSIQAQARALDRTANSANNAATALRNLSSVQIQSGTQRINVSGGGGGQQGRLDRYGELVGLGMAGRGLMNRVGESLTAAGEAQHVGTMMRAGGLTGAEVAQAEARAWETVRLTRGTTMAENLQVIGELRSTFGDLGDAMRFAPDFQRIAMTLGATTGRDPGRAARQAARFLDLRDAFVDPATGNIDPSRGLGQLRMMERSIIMNQGAVGPEQFLNFQQQAGIAGRRLDPDVMFSMMPTIIESMGGHRAGTALAALYRGTVGGVMTQRTVTELQRYGLLNGRDVSIGRGGAVTVRPGGVQGSDLLARNPFEWINTVLRPALVRQGATTTDDQLARISTLFGTETARRFVAEVIAGWPQIERNQQQFNATPQNAGEILNNEGWRTSLRNLQSSWTNLMAALGSAVIGDAIGMMNRLASGLNTLAEMATAHPQAAAIIVEIAAALGGLMIAGAAWAAGSLALSGLAGLSGALGLGAGGLAAVLSVIPWVVVIGGLVGGLVLLVNALKTPDDWRAMFGAVASGLSTLWERLSTYLGISGRTGGPGQGEMPEYDALGNPTGRMVPAPGPPPPRALGAPAAPLSFDPLGNVIPQSFQPAPPVGGGAATQEAAVYLDGRSVGRALLPHIGREASGPVQGMARFDERRATA